MKHIVKITKSFVLLCGMMMLLAGAAVLLLPRLVNLEIVKTELLEQLSTAIGADIGYDQVNVLLFPRPKVLLTNATVTAGPQLTGRVQAIHVYPAIFSVLEGHIRIDSMTLEQPDLRILLPPVSSASQFDPSVVLDAVKPVIESILAIPTIGPSGLFIQFKNGRVVLHNGTAQPFDFSRIQLSVQCIPDSVRISARSHSNLWQKVTFSGLLNTHKWNGSGALAISRLRPGPIADYLYPDSELKLIDGVSDLQIDYRFESNRMGVLNIEAGLPDIRVSRNGKEARLTGQKVSATIKADPDRTSVSLSELNMTQPRMNVSGNLYHNRKYPEMRLDLAGLDIDVGAFRNATQIVVGSMLWSEKLFAVLKNGRVPVVSLSVNTKSWQEFEKVENYLIKGSLSSGGVHIPGLGMDLTDVRGDVVIAGGLLSGNNLDARFEKSTGNDGILEIGLTRADPRFHLEVDVDAALSQVPAIVQQLFAGSYIADKSKEFHKIRGHAQGRLTCGESLLKVDASISIASFNLYTFHEKIPYPLILQGGPMTIDTHGWVAEDIRTQVGLTTLFDSSFKLDLGSEPYFTFSTRQIDVDLAEAQSIFTANGGQRALPSSFQVLKGIAFIKDLSIEGPFFSSEQWMTQWSGTISDVLLKASGLPDPILIERGQLAFAADTNRERQISVISTNLRWHSSNITAMGEIDYDSDASQVDLKVFVDRLDFDQIDQLARSANGTDPGPSAQPAMDNPVTGRIKVFTDSFTLQGFTWRPVHVDLGLNQDQLSVDIVRAQLCNIDMPGKLNLESGNLQLSFSALAERRNLAVALQCLDESDGLVTGRYSINGRITADAPLQQLPAALQGHVALTARDGRIRRYGVVAKITALLNLTEIFRGRLPDIGREGFAYDKIKLKLDIQDGKLLIRESTIQGTSMTIVSTGEIDLLNKTVDLTVLFAPFKTIDTIIENLPVINSIMGGKLISIPFKVQGPLEDYEVKPMRPTAVNSGVFGMMKNTLRLPLTMWQPMQEGEYTFDEEKLDKYRGNENVGDQ